MSSKPESLNPLLYQIVLVEQTKLHTSFVEGMNRLKLNSFLLQISE